MIDFRYHLVSIVAVFLALAIGIVVGATALQSKVVDVFYRASGIEEHQISSARTTINNQKSQINSDQAFARASAPLLLKGLLAGQRVVLVTAPGADGATVSGITAALGLAGAKVTGQAQLQPAFFSTSATTENSLEALAGKLASAAGTSTGQSAAPGASAQIAGQQQAAGVLAPALVTADGSDLPASDVSSILSGFAQQGYLQVAAAKGAGTLSQATLAVLVIPASPPSAGDADPSNQALLALAGQLKLQSRGVVLAGSYPGSGAGSAIDELINGSTGVSVSSVDNANAEAGQIMVAQALSYLVAGHKPAAYGDGPGVVPSPAPTPSPTPSASPGSKSSG